MPESTTWTLRRLAGSLRKFWFVIIAMAVVGGGAAFGAASLQTPQFQSTASLYFALNQGTNASDLNQGATYTQNQMLSFAQLAVSSRVLEPVIDDLGLDLTVQELARAIQISNPQSTVILKVTASSADPERAAAIANGVADELADVVLEVAPIGPDGKPNISAQTIDAAIVPQFQSSPNKTRDAMLGAIVGGIMGLAFALIAGIMDTRVRNEEILGEVSGAAVLGSIPRSALLSRGGITVAQDPMGATAEDFRRVRSALTYANVDSQLHTLLITSASPSEGKSTVAANLAFTLADLRHTVLLIDADLRRPRVHEVAGIDGSVGLTSVLLNESEFKDARYSVPGSSLDILPSGGIAPNPAEILTSEAMSQLIAAASEQYDFVVIDSPPILIVADASLLAPLVDGVIVVVAGVKARRAGESDAVRELEAAGARILGAVLNRARPDKHRGGYYVTDSERKRGRLKGTR